MPLCLPKLLLGSLHGRLSPSGGGPSLVHSLLSSGEFAAGLDDVLLRRAEILLCVFRDRPRLAKLLPCLLESPAFLLSPASLLGLAFTQARG
jgi:hypothetical protein